MARKRRAKTAATPGEVALAAPRIWERTWFPAALFLALSLGYFSEVAFSGKIVYGIDVGTDFHLGKESTIEKVREFFPPVWNAKMGGYPQSEEIRHHYFPTQLIYFFTSFHRHIAWRLILTMFVAGWAMYGYLRALHIRRWAAVWAGLAYMSAPTFLSFPYAGHYAKMGVIALFPLMCLLLERGLNQGRAIYFAGLGCLIAVGIYSPHLQILYFALWGLGFYFLFKMVEFYRSGHNWRQLAGRTGLFSLAVALGLGLGAEGVLPSYLYTQTASKRAASEEEGGAGKSSAEQLEFARSWSLHPEEVGSLVVPEFGGFNTPGGERFYWGRNPMKLNSEYFGILVVLLAVLAVPALSRTPLGWCMGFLFVFSLGFALGGHTPIHWIFYHLLPGVKVLRTPGIIAFLFAFPACVLAALGLDRILRVEEEKERQTIGKRLLITGGILAGIALLLALAPRGMTDAWIALFYADITPDKRQILENGYNWLARGALCVALVAGVGTALLYLRLRRQLGAGLVLCGLGVLTLVDTWRIDRVYLEYVNPAERPDIRMENRRTMEFLERGDELFRVFPFPSFNILRQDRFHLYGVNQVTGFHDLTPRRYDRILEEFSAAVGLLEAKYFSGKTIPYSDEVVLESIHPLLNLLNAKYLAVPQGIALNSPRFAAVFSEEMYTLYENPTAMPWFYLVPSYQVLQGEEKIIAQLRNPQFDPRQTVVLEEEPAAAFAAAAAGDSTQERVECLDYDLDSGYMRLETSSGGPRVLVVSENFYPNWRFFVDGQEAPMYRANYVWMAVCLPPGEHVVELRYSSWTTRLSRWFMGASLVVVLALVGWDLKRRRSAAPSGAA